MKITIVAEVADDLADPDHTSGLTSEAHESLFDALLEQGLSDIDIRKGSA